MVFTQIMSNKEIDFFTQSKVIEWQDQQVINIDLTLRKNIERFFQQLDLLFVDVDFLDIFTSKGRNTFIEKEINPRLAEWEEEQSKEIIGKANREWKKIQKQIVSYSHVSEKIDDRDESVLETTQILAAISPIAAGVMAIPFFAGASVVSSGGILGILGVSVISWPVALIGVTVVGTLVSFGVYKSSNLKKSVAKKYTDSLKAHIRKRIIEDEKSLRRQLIIQIKQQSNKVLKEYHA